MAHAESGHFTAVTASQLISPVLWDHHALLLLPTAWLLAHGRWWAVAIPLATSVILIWLASAVHPVACWRAPLAPLAVERIGGYRAADDWYCWGMMSTPMSGFDGGDR